VVGRGSPAQQELLLSPAQPRLKQTQSGVGAAAGGGVATAAIGAVQVSRPMPAYVLFFFLPRLTLLPQQGLRVAPQVPTVHLPCSTRCMGGEWLGPSSGLAVAFRKSSSGPQPLRPLGPAAPTGMRVHEGRLPLSIPVMLPFL